jgi:hypothetical protein
MAVSSDWTNIVAAIGGGVGTLTGIAALIVSAKSSFRSARAAEQAAASGARAADSSERSADYATFSTAAAQKSADAAEAAVMEAGVLSRIEKARFHRELGPSPVRIHFVWTPSQAGGDVWAEVFNDAAHDLRAEFILDFAQNGSSTLTHRVVHAKSKTRVNVNRLPISDFGQMAFSAGGWQGDSRELALRGAKAAQSLAGAFQESPLSTYFLVVRYSTFEQCPCDVTPASDTYGHWTMKHPIEDVSL